MLYDKDFLLKLDKEKNKVIYARITALTFQETPVEYIEGRVTQGSINLDGASAVRRSCSLTIVAQDFNYSDYYWGLNTKFKLEIGVENTIDFHYPDIIWFNQGIYLITSFNTSRNTSSFNISIQGKDKMCLLNGEVGGQLESSIDFGTIEEEDKNGNWVIRKLPIQEIIRNAVHTYGGEPYHNIIINDLDTYGLELLEYRYDTPLYLYRSTDQETPLYTNVMIENDTTPLWIKTKSGVYKQVPMSELDGKDSEGNPILDWWGEEGSIYLESLVTTLQGEEDSLQEIYTEIGATPKSWYFTKVEWGQTAGYRMTDLIYAGDLIAKVGESVTSVLDKIKNMLAEFEYFYNLEGQFVFQKKQSFKETMWLSNPDEYNAALHEGSAITSSRAYEFYGGELITAFNNNPNLLNLKNDYSIWGERESISGAKMPIHMRYAIDKKPIRYKQIYVPLNDEQVDAYNKKYNTELPYQVIQQTFSTADYDWREIIYQMALDYYRYNILDDFELRVAEANPIDYPSGRTGYEQYYVDMQGFWRELYYPGLEQEVNGLYYEVESLKAEVNAMIIEVYGEESDYSDNRLGGIENELYCLNNYVSTGKPPIFKDSDTGVSIQNDEKAFIAFIVNKYKFKDSNGHIINGLNELGNIDEDEVQILLSMLNDHYFRRKSELETKQYKLEQLENEYTYMHDYRQSNYYTETSHPHKNWNRNVYEQPELLNFWFDFLDTSGELQQFSVQSIGSRSKSINDTNVKSIYNRETPSVIFVTSDEEVDRNSGFKYIQVPDIETMFTCSAQGKSAKEKLDELIYQHGYCVESATITTIPIYYLEPNIRVYLHDEETGLDGDYIVSKITIPLTYNGTMSLTATKAAENIL